MKYLLLLFTTVAIADPHWYHQPTTNTQETPVINNYVTEVTEITEISDYNYTLDECNGVALSQAIGNNHMYGSTSKPQVSIGMGECSGEVAGSFMVGIKPWTNGPLINGSIAVDEDVRAFGIGASFIFR